MFLTSKVTAEFRKIVQSKIDLCDWDIHKTNIAEVGWGGGSMIFFFTAWDGSERSIPGADVSLTQFFNHFSYVLYSKQLILILLRFVLSDVYFISVSMCVCIYVHCMCAIHEHMCAQANGDQRSKSGFIFLEHCTPYQGTVSRWDLNSPNWVGLMAYQKPKGLPCLPLQLWDFRHQPPDLIFYMAYKDQPLGLMVKQHITRLAISSTCV